MSTGECPELLRELAALDPEHYRLVIIIMRNLRGPHENAYVDAYSTAEPIRSLVQKPPTLAPAPVGGQAVPEKVQKMVSFFPEQDIKIGEVGSEGKTS